MDNDYGEHWFGNWDLREPPEAKATALGLDVTELFILDPDRFKNGKDGPCHTPAERVQFWKDMLMSLRLSYATLFNEARKRNAEYQEPGMEEYLPDLENRIIALTNGHQLK